MDLAQCLARLAANAEAFTHLLDGISQAQARWKPSAEEWSLLEVVNHLYDEEREDFRQRLELTLRDPTLPWLPNDPCAKVTERAYNQRDLQQSLASLLEERQQSLVWLRALVDPDWNVAHQNQYGTLRAGDLLVSWVAHDVLHLRQIVELRWKIEQAQAAPFSVAYAGDW